MNRLLRTLLVFLLPALCAPAQAEDSIAIRDRRELALERGTARPSHHLSLVLAYFEGGWTPEVIRSALRKSARLLEQCGVAITKAELVLLAAPARFHDFHTPDSRELASACAPERSSDGAPHGPKGRDGVVAGGGFEPPKP